MVRRGGRARRLAHVGEDEDEGTRSNWRRTSTPAPRCCVVARSTRAGGPVLACATRGGVKVGACASPMWRDRAAPNYAAPSGGASSWRRRVSRTCLSSPPISECTGAYLHRQRRVLAAPVAAGLREVVCVCMCVCGWGAMFPSALALACPRCSLTAGPSFLCAASFFYLQEARAAAGAARGAAAGWQCGDEGCDRPRREAGAPAATRSGAGFEAGAAGRC